MRKDYQRMQEDLLPGKETREWIWEAIEEKAAKRKKPDMNTMSDITWQRHCC